MEICTFAYETLCFSIVLLVYQRVLIDGFPIALLFTYIYTYIYRHKKNTEKNGPSQRPTLFLYIYIYVYSPGDGLYYMNIMNLYEPILVKLYLIHIKYQLLNLTINLLVE
jgi:hypothetical protein